ncbi:MAG: SRPBCC family protein [Dehalococcoidia bacterium]
MTTFEKSIDIDVPVSTAYNQWTQFEQFPQFMEGVQEVRQLDDRRLHWVVDVAGTREEWDAMITRQEPDRCIAWESEAGTPNRGMVTFQPLESGKTRVTLEMEYEPSEVIEKVGDALGFVSRRVTGDLERFKEFIEGRGLETGAWRGVIR